MCVKKINSIQKHPKFLPTDLSGSLFAIRPGELIPFKPFLPKTKPVSVPIQRFQYPSLAITEQKQVPTQRILRHLLPGDERKSVHLFPHVGLARSQIHRGTAEIYTDHNDAAVSMISRSSSTRIGRSISIVTVLPTRIRILPDPSPTGGTLTRTNPTAHSDTLRSLRSQ